MPRYDEMLIHIGKYWKVFLLWEDQSCLGSVYLWLKRDGVTDLFQIREAERDELFELGRRVCGALTEAFKPDLFNYMSLGNRTSQLHIKVIPRYEGSRILEGSGTRFVDANWGGKHVPADKEVQFTDDVLSEIRDKIREALEQ